MDIFVIKTESLNNVPSDMLVEFQQKEIANVIKRQEHSFTYLMLDRVLREFYKISNREIVFEGKKPVLKSKEKFFSLSHSKGYVALVFSDYTCGIDIEQNQKRDYEKIAKRMNLACNSLETFYTAWTEYEACYKLGGTPATVWNTVLDGYTLTAVSSEKEVVNFYLQSN